MNKLILGTVQFGMPYGINNQKGQPTFQEVFDILSFAYDNGIRYLDTAEVYGNSHSIIGDFHKNNYEKKFNIITKLPIIDIKIIENKVLSYLKQLCVSNIHALLFHSFEMYKENQFYIEKLIEFKKRGIVNNLGVSIYTNKQFEEAIEDNNIDIIQLPFNLFDNLFQRAKMLKLAKSKNKIIHSRSAFLQGLFFMPVSSENRIVKELNKPLNLIHRLSEKTGFSVQNIALSYCLMQKDIDNVLIGVDNLEQLKVNLEGINISLPDNVLFDIDNIKIENTDLLNPSLWNQ